MKAKVGAHDGFQGTPGPERARTRYPGARADRPELEWRQGRQAYEEDVGLATWGASR